MRKLRKTKHDDYEIRVIFEALARYRVRIIFSSDMRRSWDARFPRTRLVIGDDCGAFHHTFNNGESQLFFIIADCKTGTVAHECMHAVYALLDFIGAGFKEEEFITYHLDYLVQRVQDFKNDLIDAGVGVKSRKKKR
jgi:hypothetical protein